jgi:beta-aspartyl-peptidase (threonine type)
VKPILVIHGGAWAMPDDAVGVHERGIQAALKAGWSALSKGGTAVDAVEAAITVMENDDTFDAGRGSFLTRDGRVQMDALLMQGKDLRAGGVACVERLRNPIQAARLVLERSPHVYFVGTGAERFATQHGMLLVDNSELIVQREKDRLMQFQIAEAAGGKDTTFSGEAGIKEQGLGIRNQTEADAVVEHAVAPGLDVLEMDVEATGGRESHDVFNSHDTVGAVAMDAAGNLAAGTSTGGTLSKAPGRVGDSSLIGCGCYADNESAAVSLTGWGEPIMKLVLGKWAVDRVAAGTSPDEAAGEAIEYLYSRLGGHGGIILLGPDGRVGLAHNTPRMAWGIAREGEMRFGVKRN